MIFSPKEKRLSLRGSFRVFDEGMRVTGRLED